MIELHVHKNSVLAKNSKIELKYQRLKNMKPTFGSAYLDDNLTQFTTIHYSFHVINKGYDINRGHYLKRVVINIRTSKSSSGLVKIPVTSHAGLVKFFLIVEPCKALMTVPIGRKSSFFESGLVRVACAIILPPSMTVKK